MNELEAMALATALKLLMDALMQKKITPDELTKGVQDMIWKAVREEV